MSCRHGNHHDGCDICDEVDASFEAGRRSALAEQPAQQEPVAYFNPQVKGGFYWAKPTKITAPVTVSVEPIPLYTTPQAQPAREWAGLTPEESVALFERHGHRTGELVGAVEDKLKEKNT